MKNIHIIEIIDGVSVASLSQSELDEVKAHALECASCHSAFEAAQLCASAIKQRAEVKIEPSPFFQTRVLAAWREQQADNVPAFVRLWKSARALVSAMAVATLALAVVSFVAPEQATAGPDQTASVYSSAESVIFDQADEQLSYEQVLNAIYEEDEAK